MITLNPSNITFDPVEHTYTTPEGQQLSGITELLSSIIFPDRHQGIDPETLAAAAQRGTAVHALCQFEDQTGEQSYHENEQIAEAAHQYTILREQHGYQPIANEYNVTDNTRYASNIDCVWHRNADKDDQVTLVDIKTTYNLDRDYLAWQLAIYNFLFTQQNPHLHVARHLAVWLPFRAGKFASEKAEIVTITPAPIEQVIALLYNPENLVLPTAEQPTTTLPQITDDYISQYINAVHLIQHYQETKDTFTKALTQAMQQHSIRTWDAQRIRATLTQPTTRRTFDTDKFKKDHPDLYEQYLSEKQTKPSLRITLREE